MTINLAEVYHARADHCTRQALLNKDNKIKKFWDDLANDWLLLEASQQLLVGEVIPEGG